MTRSLLSIPDLIRFLKRRAITSSYPVNRGEDYQPFFIVGTPRSGNTLVRRLLYAHPDLHIPPETFVLKDVVRIFREYCRMPWPDLVYLILAQFEFYPEFETFEISLRPLAKCLLNVPEDSRSLAYIMDSFYRYHAESKGVECKRWGDKTPLNTFALEEIYSVFPDAQFIYMIRDGVDVVSSLLEADLYTDLDSAANRWIAAVQAVNDFAQQHAEICLEIRYETLVRKPGETLSLICDFLNIEYYPGMLESQQLVQDMGDVAMRPHHEAVGRPISNRSIGKGKQQLTLAQRQRLHKLLSDELERLGYESTIAIS